MCMMDLPEQVRRALARLEGAGYEAFVVGGAVRDYVRGADTGTDWDITTSALPEETEAVFSGCRVIETGIKHGTVTVLPDGEPLEITTYRVDGGYSDHRHPDEVRFTRSLREDLRRRDFTMNAMAYSPRTGVVDPFGGQADLAAGVVRCVGEPDRRFQEDALRILRALRFASVLGMHIHPDTARAARDNRALLAAVAAERVRSELTKLLCGADAERVLLEFPDILSVPLPEIGAMVGFDQHNPHHDRDIWAHTAAVTAAIQAQPVLRWAALLHDVGKPPCFSLAEDGVGHFYGHAGESARMADGILRRLRFDTDSREEIVRLIRYHDLPIQPERKPVKRLMNKLGPDTVRRLIELHKADTRGQSAVCAGRIAEYDAVAAVLDEILNEKECFSLRNLAVSGTDMTALGLTGRDIGRTLNACLTAVMEEKLPNERGALLEYAEQLKNM
jgi:tRNA nucleotidyltransferase (CCA-adding enzyme)